MLHKKQMNKAVLAVLAVAVSPSLYAAGFQLNESSASGLGRAFAGEGAVADNASVGSRNPAAMTMFDRPVFSGGVIYVRPKVDVSGTSPKGNSLDAKNIAPNEWVPNLHYIHPMNDRWALGTSATTNYGLSTDYSDDYAAGPLAGKTELMTMNFNLSTAYRLTEQFSAGIGANVIYAKAKIIRHAGENNAQLGLDRDAEVAYLSGDKWGYGWNAGLLYELNENNRFGLTYRSKVDIDFKGDYRSDISSSMNGMQSLTGLPWGTDGQTTTGNLTLNLPEIWEFSAYHKVAPKWAVHYSIAYTSWSQFQELEGTDSSGNTLFYKHEGFKDSMRVALGSTYYHNENWTYRAGIALDDSAAPASNRSISIPDQDRVWLTLGSTYNFNKDASVDVGVAYMHGQKVDVEEKASNAANSPVYSFQSKGAAWLYGINLNYSF